MNSLVSKLPVVTTEKSNLRTHADVRPMVSAGTLRVTGMSALHNQQI